MGAFLVDETREEKRIKKPRQRPMSQNELARFNRGILVPGNGSSLQPAPDILFGQELGTALAP